MRLHNLLLFALFVLFGVSAKADNEPLWLRYPSISPDGEKVAFSFKGNIYVVDAKGGEAKALTTHNAYESYPIWSPDSKQIAFGSARNGGMDVFLIGVNGGSAKQLTFHSSYEVPIAFTPDGKAVLYSADIMPSRELVEFPRQAQVYQVSVNGGRPSLFLPIQANAINFNEKGDQFVFYDKKGYEDTWRKHHTSSVCRDIWMYDMKTKKYTSITKKEVEDRDPLYTNSDKDLYFLSERFGTFNVCKLALSNPEKVQQVTSFKTHPVRFLTKSKNDVLCFTYNGEIYTMKQGQSPKKLKVSITSEDNEKSLYRYNASNGASAMVLSPNNKELALIVRGDIFVTSADYNTSRAITNTPQQERDLSFSPDGRKLAFSAERDGNWQIYMVELADTTDKTFTYAKRFEEKQITKGSIPCFTPKFSPDGKEIAFLRNRTEIVVKNLKSGKERVVLPGKYNYSYSDGDQSFSWSPNGKWILAKYFEYGGWQNTDIALVKADGSQEIHNLTQSGYSDADPSWAMNGDVILWSSDRNGYRSHGSWGSQRDIYAMFLSDEAWNKFRLSKEDKELLDEEDRIMKMMNTPKATKDSKKKDTKATKPAPVEKVINFDILPERVVRLTRISGNMGTKVLTNDGSKLYFLSSYEGGFDLWVNSFKDNSTRILTKGVGYGAMSISKDEHTIFLLSGNGLKKINTANGQVSNKGFSATVQVQPAKEREYIFNHAWQQVTDKFYDPTIRGIDWKGFKMAYARFLPYINNNYDFAELLSEMLGELNASHTGARYSSPGSEYNTMALGAFFDDTYKGDGLKIAEVLDKGPLAQPGSKVEVGEVITSINNHKIKAGEDYYPLFNNLTSSRLLVDIYNPSTKKTRTIYIKAISAGSVRALLYNRWVASRRAEVDKLSNGRLGYIHIQEMNAASFSKVFSDLMGKYRNKEAVVIDTRSNGGGWLHEDLITLLTGVKYADFSPRGQHIGQDPLFRWTKPSIVLMSENNYSNAHGFPWAYKANKVGKLVGAPVPGTMTAVWWENQQDGSLVFGIPQLGMKDMNGNYLENQELQPDIKVYNDYNSVVNGKDPQLEAAVQSLLNDLKK